MILLFMKSMFHSMVSLIRNYTTTFLSTPDSPDNPKCRRKLNEEVILKFEPSYQRHFKDFYKNNSEYDIWKMNERLKTLIFNKRFLKYSLLDEIVNHNPVTPLKEKNRQIMRYNDTNPLSFIEEITSKIVNRNSINNNGFVPKSLGFVPNDPRKEEDKYSMDDGYYAYKDQESFEKIWGSNENSEVSLGNAPLSTKIAPDSEVTKGPTVNKSKRVVFAVNSKTLAYLDALSKSIEKNTLLLDSKKSGKIKDILLNLRNTNVFKNVEVEIIHKNLAYVVTSIIGKLFNSTKTSNAGISQQTLRRDLGKFFIESYVIATNIAIHGNADNIQGYRHFQEEKDKFMEKISSESLVSGELAKFEESDMCELGSFFLMCLQDARVDKPANTNTEEPAGQHESLIVEYDSDKFKSASSEGAEDNEGSVDVQENLDDTQQSILIPQKTDHPMPTYSSTGKQKKKTTINFVLSDFGRQCLELSSNQGSVYPLLKKALTYTKGNTYYSGQFFKFSMYRYSDESNVRDECTSISDAVYEAVNYLQDMEYAVDKSQLAHVENNLLEYFLILSEFQYSALKYATYEDYYRSNLGFIGFDIPARVAAHRAYLINEQLLQKMTETVCIAQIYKDHVFYFNHFLDFRGRIYCHGYPLSPQGDFITRSLITVNKQTNLIGHDVTASGFQIIGLLTGSLELLELTNYIARNMHDSIDYRSPPYRDLYEKIRVGFTEFLRDYIRGCMSAPSKMSSSDKKTKEEKKEENRQAKIAEIFRNPKKLDALSVVLRDNFFDRALIKDMSMCYIYGESSYSRGSKIDKRYSELTNGKESPNLSVVFASLFELYIKEAFPVLYEFKKDITALVGFVCGVEASDESVENSSESNESDKDSSESAESSNGSEETPRVSKNTVKNLKKYSKENLKGRSDKEDSKDIVKNTNLFKLRASKFHITTVLNYVEYSKYQHSFYNVVQRKTERISFSMPKIPLTLDIRKTKRAVLANYIHMVDSVIAMRVILRCKNEGIKLFSVHDSFYVDSRYTNRIKEIYFTEARDLILNDHPLLHLLEVNNSGLPESKDKMEIYSKLHKYVESSKKFLSSSEVVMNENVLKLENKNYHSTKIN